MKEDRYKDTIKFHASYVVYENPMAGFKIISGVAYNADTGERIRKCSAKGNLLDVSEDDEIFAVGHWDDHPVYGPGFVVSSYCKAIPHSASSMLKFLEQGHIDGITKRLARRIVDMFQDSTYDVLMRDHERLKKVKGIGVKTAEKIHKSAFKTFAQQEMLFTVMSYIQDFGISPAYAKRIYNQYGLDSMKVIQKNPYKLAEDISGIGFQKADEIALKNNIEPDSPMRVESALQYVLKQENDNGDVFGYCDDVKRDCQTLLGVPVPLIDNSIQNLKERGRIVVDGDALYLKKLYYAEDAAAAKLSALLRFGTQRNFTTTDKEIRDIGKKSGFEYAPEQIQAIKTAVSSGVMILTGGPGTGKTTTIRTILKLLRRHGMKVICAAPTGKAAKKMREATGDSGAVTIHKLLGAVGDADLGFRFQKNKENPLQGDVLILDECSMIDISLFDSVLQAVPLSMKVVLVGDVDQLPSVGCGNVFRDLIESGALPTVRLEHIFRQGQQSLIVENAHKINNGIVPDLTNYPDADFYFRDVAGMDNEEIRDLIVKYVCKYIPRKYGVDPYEIQVLSPVKKGDTGVYQLNSYIQNTINPASPDKPEFLGNGSIFRLGDKIMCIRNDYDRQVFNGDVGKIVKIRNNDDDEKEDGWDDDELNENSPNTFTVDFNEPGRSPVTFKFSESDKFTLAYAMTVHKSQGSEYDYMILVATSASFMMMKRNLLYTGVTRAKKFLCVIGQPRMISVAVHDGSIAKRNTRLKERLQKYCDEDNMLTA